jgi:YD repeat-containing protein
MSSVSQPYAPGATVYWTSYTHDGSGRTLTVTAADGHSQTQYAYQGNSTTVTDAAGKWKTSTVDAYGNLILVTEPNPAGGANFTTTYAYNSVDQLTTVTMPRSTGTQTRSFTYSGSDMLTATNPENGTVTYTYDNSHHVVTRTDAIGYKTQYSYDSYGRKSMSQYFDLSNNEYMNQRVTYSYDAGGAPAHSVGRLTGIAFGGGVTDAYHDSYSYAYQYNAAGRVTTQSMGVGAGFGYYNAINFTATYQWDNEGRMTSLGYPTVLAAGSFGNMPVSMPTAGLQYDANGRLDEITMDSHDGNGPQWLAGATYTAAGQVHQLSHGPWTETRQYNALGQLTNQTAPYAMNLTYNYSATQNNGRITGSVDTMTGESTSYSYDALNRLTAASNSLWSQGYSYDGFGNLTAKTGANAMSATYDVRRFLRRERQPNGVRVWLL